MEEGVTVDSEWEHLQVKESICQCASLVKLEGPDEHLPGGYINASYIQTYGQLRVTNKSLSYNQHSVCKRLFEVHNLQDTNAPHIVVHYEYLGWPDQGVPKSTQLVRELVRELCKITPTAGPFVGHCSAGIGRSGTYCTIDHTLRRVIHADLTAVDLQRGLSDNNVIAWWKPGNNTISVTRL